MFLVVLVLSSAQIFAHGVDYELYNHKITLTSVRAGNHDASGVNDYYFSATLVALKNTKDELAKEIKDRANLKNPLGTFGDINLEVLRVWRPDAKKKEAPLTFIVAGNSIRKIVSDAMREFKVTEKEIAVMIEVEMFEREKTFGYFGEDTRIASVQYFPFAPTEYQTGGRTNQELNIVDDKGTDVDVKIVYDMPEITTAVKTTPSETANPPLK